MSAPAASDEAAPPPPPLRELLRHIPLFSGLAPRHIERLAAIGGEERHTRNARLFSEGDVGDKFYLILEGQVRISRQVPAVGEEAIAVLGPGTYFGEMALIDDAARSADALAHEDCRLFVLTKEDMEDLLFVDRDLAYELLWSFVRTLSARLRETNDKIAFLTLAGRF
ncbi:MAG: cyclic nucleotide-binding domain-containing protein [Myxococcota bacterium]